jgi:hypothetical protein
MTIDGIATWMASLSPDTMVSPMTAITGDDTLSIGVLIGMGKGNDQLYSRSP